MRTFNRLRMLINARKKARSALLVRTSSKAPRSSFLLHLSLPRSRKIIVRIPQYPPPSNSLEHRTLLLPNQRREPLPHSRVQLVRVGVREEVLVNFSGTKGLAMETGEVRDVGEGCGEDDGGRGEADEGVELEAGSVGSEEGEERAYDEGGIECADDWWAGGGKGRRGVEGRSDWRGLEVGWYALRVGLREAPVEKSSSCAGTLVTRVYDEDAEICSTPWKLAELPPSSSRLTIVRNRGSIGRLAKQVLCQLNVGAYRPPQALPFRLLLLGQHLLRPSWGRDLPDREPQHLPIPLRLDDSLRSSILSRVGLQVRYTAGDKVVPGHLSEDPTVDPAWRESGELDRGERFEVVGWLDYRAGYRGLGHRFEASKRRESQRSKELRDSSASSSSTRRA